METYHQHISEFSDENLMAEHYYLKRLLSDSTTPRSREEIAEVRNKLEFVFRIMESRDL